MTIWQAFRKWVRCIFAGHDLVFYPQLYQTKCMRCKAEWWGCVY